MKKGRKTMGRRLAPRYLAALDFSTYTDQELHKLVSDINLAAPTCTLVQASPPMQECVQRLVAKDATLTKTSKKVDDDKATLRTDLATEALARTDLQGEARTYASFVQGAAKSPADVQGAALNPKQHTPRNQPPTVPDHLESRPPKRGHGRITVFVVETGTTHHQFAAEQSLDGVTFTQLGVSHGKTRVVTGPSGTKVWVRFAMVRGSLQSDWSIPIIVTIP
jgi:hypothetical protein